MAPPPIEVVNIAAHYSFTHLRVDTNYMVLLAGCVLEEAMYWGDAKLGRLEKSRLDGSARRLIHQNTGDRYFSIALSPHYLYVTDWTERLYVFH